MYITASLASALRHLRDRYRKRQVWADAICINQDDIEERNQQVRQMASVYSLAHHTVIFLGEGTSKTTQFLDILQSNASKHGGLVSGSHLAESLTDLSNNIEEPAMQWILSRPWFRRVWTLQELVLSRDPWIQCGTSLTRWETLRIHITTSGRESREEEKLFRSMSELHLEHLNELFREVKPRNQQYDIYNERSVTAEKLFDLLVSRKGFGVSDPRDMLFANVGLVPNLHSNDDPLLDLIAVDYEKDEVQVYVDLTCYFLEVLGDPALSLLDGAPRLVKNLPSWVPDWTSVPHPLYVPLASYPKRSYGIWVYRRRIRALDSHVLATPGIVFGKVLEVDPTIMTVFEPWRFQEIFDLSGRLNWTKEELWKIVREEFEETYREWKHILGPSRDPQKIPISRFDPSRGFLYEDSWTDAEERLAREITLNYFSLGDLLSQPNCSRVLDRIRDREWSWVNGYGDQDGHWGCTILTRSLLVHLVFSSLLASKNTLFSRKFALLDDGILALVPASTQVGDVAAMSMQDSLAPLPMVLRPVQVEIDPVLDVNIKQASENQKHKISLRSFQSLTGWKPWMESLLMEVDHFTFVGECFVEGKMGTMTDLSDSKLKLLALH
jgi:hypothetical protein